jgi:enterochelin esterase-like enzyme/outer membrane protein assembly factor BamB
VVAVLPAVVLATTIGLGTTLAVVEGATEPSATTTSAATTAGLEVVWRRPLGPGHSRIVVAGRRALTLFSDGISDYLIALDTRSGDELWRYRIAETYGGHDGSRDGPHASPVVDDGLVYSLGPRGHLFAVGIEDGHERWSRDIVAELGATAPFWGFASTPVLAGDVLAVPTGGGTAGSVSGFNRRTGDLLWSVGEDLVGYQSAAVMPLAGDDQIVAVTNHQLMGLAPETGAVLWTYQHTEADLDGSSEPVAIGSDQFLLTPSFTEHVSDTMLFRASPQPGGLQVERMWATGALRSSYTIPVKYGAHLFGFQRGFLTCVDLDTGQVVWKSRAPGGRNLILVDGQLVILANDGSVVVAAASAEGYEEVARVEALDRGAYSAPAYGDGLILVRNHRDIAAVSVREVAEAPGDAPDRNAIDTISQLTADSEFAAFVNSVARADRQARPRLITEFMDRHDRFPIIEGDLAHFVYHGGATDVAIQGIGTGWGEIHPLARIAETDFFYRSYALDPAGRWEYVFEIDMARWVRDPLNPRRAPGPREDSELVMPGWRVSDHMREPMGARGTVDAFQFESEILGNARDVRVYLPPGYARSNDRYPLLVVIDGLDVLRYGAMDRALDNLIGETVTPIVVAFVGPSNSPDVSHREAGGTEAYREHGGVLTPVFSRALTDELLPHLDATYRTVREPESRAVMGIRAGGLVALHTAVHSSSVFGKVAVQSMWLGPTELQSSRLRPRPAYEAILSVIESGPRLPLDIYVNWAHDDLRSRGEDIDLPRDLEALVEMFRGREYRVSGGEYPGASGWGSWQARTDEILEMLFPIN